MSVRVTDHKHAALYCSTTGEAFGPVFRSADDAWAFQEWLAVIVFEQPVCDLYDLKGVIKGDGDDPREWPPDDLVKLVRAWETSVRDREPSDVEMFGAGTR